MKIKNEIRKLNRMTIEELRSKYQDVLHREAPSGHRDFLIRKIAWGIQANEYGGLSEAALRRAEELTAGLGAGQRGIIKGLDWVKSDGRARTVTKPFKPRRDSRIPMVGTMLTRQYQGQTLAVLVLDEGFEFEGQVYKSLTGLVKKITGSHWNGYDFFLGSRRKAVGV